MPALTTTMPVSDLPNLDHVYAKWENRGPKDPNCTMSNGICNNNGGVSEERIKAGGLGSGKGRRDVGAGRQKWRDKFGTNVQPLRQRRTRDKQRVVAVSTETIQLNTIARFKSSPTVLPEHFNLSRPFMGACCACMPNSQKDLISPSTSTEGMRNILDVRHELRGSGMLSRQFATLVYTWRQRTQHKYPDLSMATLTSPRVVEVIHEELLAEEVRQDQARLEKRAREILNVMKSKISNSLTKFTSWFLHHFLSLLLGGVHVNKGQMKMIKTAEERGSPLLFLPLHKSHLDYILITFILTNYEIKNPNIAAGDNLNIPFFSYLMRHLGGYFIRRKLDDGKRKDRLYRTVLHSYMEQLISHGECLEFFLEGGRSRTGKALQPKGGLLSVVIDSINKGVVEDVYVVPVSISYEKLLDGNFNSEQMGLAKKKESFFGAVKAIWAALRCYYGNVRVDFSQPFSLKECMASCSALTPVSSPSASSSEFPSLPSSPDIAGVYRTTSRASIYGTEIVIEDQRALINNIGLHVVHTCVESSALMCTNLLAFLFLTKHRQGCTLETLICDFTWLREECGHRKRDLGFSPSTSSRDVILYTLPLLGQHLVNRSKGAERMQDMLTPCLDIPTVFEMSYYSNHVISTFLLESVLVCSVLHLSDIHLSTLESSSTREVILMSREEIVDVAQQLCALLDHEFIFAPPCSNLETLLTDTLDQLVMCELLKTEDSNQLDTYENMFDRQWATRLSDSLSWAEDGEEENYTEELLRVNIEREDCQERLRFFHNMLGPFLETYLVTAHHITDLTDTEMPENDFVKRVHGHAKQRVLDGVANFNESAALESVRTAVKAFKSLRMLESYTASNVPMVEIHSRYDVQDSINQYIQLLESLRG